jgi:hypothetical protein
MTIPDPMGESLDLNMDQPGVAQRGAPRAPSDLQRLAMVAQTIGREECLAVDPALASEIATWDGLSEDERAPWHSTVRAVLAAMREPTQAQYDALCATDKLWREQTSETVWKTYIDALLADGSEATTTGQLRDDQKDLSNLSSAERASRLEAALRNLTMIARTSGGVAGPDAELMFACSATEKFLSETTPEPK